MFLAINEIKDAKLRYSLIVGLLTLVSYLMYFLSGLAFGLIDQNRSSIDHWKADTVLLSSEANKTIGLSNLKLSDKEFIKSSYSFCLNIILFFLVVTLLSDLLTDSLYSNIFSIYLFFKRNLYKPLIVLYFLLKVAFL